MAFKSLFVGIVLVGLIIVAMLQGFSLLADQNDKSSVLLEDEIISRTVQSINTSINTLDQTGNETKSRFEEDSASLSVGDLLFGSILNSGKVFTTVVVGTFTGVFTLIGDSLGIKNTIIIPIFTGLLLIVIVLLLWRLIKTGE